MAKNEKQEIAKRLERKLKYHRQKHKEVTGRDPAQQLRQEGAVSALETLWLSLVQDGLIDPSNELE